MTYHAHSGNSAGAAVFRLPDGQLLWRGLQQWALFTIIRSFANNEAAFLWGERMLWHKLRSGSEVREYICDGGRCSHIRIRDIY